MEETEHSSEHDISLYTIPYHPSWTDIIEPEKKKEYFSHLNTLILNEYNSPDVVVLPKHDLIFNAMKLTPFDEIRMVILGQDPYPSSTQIEAHGLAFSVPRTITSLPKSLVNIFYELVREFPGPCCDYKGTVCTTSIISPSFTFTPEQPHGSFTNLAAKQGVLLLNTILTVRRGIVKSHHDFGWEQFTTHILEEINERLKNVVFLLWGRDAQNAAIAAKIDFKKHLILTAPHPSPLSASRGFFGCNHFITANKYLVFHGKPPINWSIH